MMKPAKIHNRRKKEIKIKYNVIIIHHLGVVSRVAVICL